MTAATSLGGHSAAYTHAVWLVATLAGVILLVALAAVYRRARAARELEDAERILAAEDGTLDG